MGDLAGGWVLSRYARFIPRGSDGSGLLYNSFMGALAWLDPDRFRRLEAVLCRARDKNRIGKIAIDLDSGDPLFKELRDQHFVVPAALNEAKAVENLLQKERDFATHVILMPHEDCNFRCTYCYETFERGKMAPEMVEAVKQFARWRIPKSRLFNIGWFGGEPCLARDIIEELSALFLDQCEAAGIPYRSAITTNGYFLDEPTVDMLLRSGVGHFQVTIDGAEKAHNTVRHLRGGQPTYRRIFDNLVAMTRRSDAFNVAIRINFNPTTVALIADFLREAAPHFAADDRFFLDFHAVGRWGGPNDRDMAVIEEASATSTRIGLIRDAACQGFSPSSVLDALKPHGSACYAGKKNSMVIGADGRIYKCTVAFSDERNQVGQLQLDGTLDLDAAKWRLWTEPGASAEKCDSCSFFASCQSRACPLAAIEMSEPPCPFTDAEFEEMVRFAAEDLVAPLPAGA